jgi:hypothetical protein
MQVLDHLASHRAYQLDLVRGESLNLRKHIQVVMQCQVLSRQIDCDFVSLEHQQGSALVNTPLPLSESFEVCYLGTHGYFILVCCSRVSSQV